MKRYYVVLEVRHEADQLGLHEMATWVASAMEVAAVGSVDAIVYESAADLYFEETSQPPPSPTHPGYYCKDCTNTFKRLGRSGGHPCCPHCGSERYAGIIVVRISEE